MYRRRVALTLVSLWGLCGNQLRVGDARVANGVRKGS